MWHRVFVYGTLMKGELHHTTMAHARFIGQAETEPRYELVQIDYYPAMLPDGAHAVHGELYEVDDATLRRLDELEEVPHYYERHELTLADGTKAFAYVMPRTRAPGATPIASGYFRMRTAPPKTRR
jgi:gamma-glutamylaminecyclotransferase